jgi:hypothetical protein
MYGKAGNRSSQVGSRKSCALQKSVVYSDAILQAVRDTPAGAKVTPLLLPESYMREAADIARRRIIAAGLRLGATLKNEAKAQSIGDGLK